MPYPAYLFVLKKIVTDRSFLLKEIANSSTSFIHWFEVNWHCLMTNCSSRIKLAVSFVNH